MASESIYAKAESGSTGGPEDHQGDDIPPNPFLTKPLLHISQVQPSVSDKELAGSVFTACLPVRLHIERRGETDNLVSGTVEFHTLEKAEKAYATIQAPTLSINQDAASDPKPAAKPRLIKQLPHGTEDGDVFDLFRSYGPLYSCHRIVTNPAGHHTGFRGMAIVLFYEEQDAQQAQTEMHCAEVDGKTISVSIDTVVRQPPQESSFSPAAAPFIPGSGSSMSADAPVFQPPSANTSSPPGTHSPHAGPMLSVPGSNLQYSTNSAIYIDPCNLFCKNLDPNIDSNELFSLFKGFGKIVSARVMRDERGTSREFGFVSFRRAEDANRAMNSMNGALHGSKQMTVRLHEPKNVRQEKLSQKFGSAYHATSAAADSPEESGSPSSEADGARQRRMSNSYFRAAASGEDGEQVDLGQLQSMNSTLRNDILRGGFSRKIKQLGVKDEQTESLVAELSKLHLPDAVAALNDPQQLHKLVTEAQSKLFAGTCDSVSGDGASMASADTPPMTERQRILKAVTANTSQDAPVEDIADLIVGLPKRERALALFNLDYLRTKIEEAKAILDLSDEESISSPTTRAITSPLTKANLDIANDSAHNTENKPPNNKPYTLADVARMPAAEIIHLANSPQAAGLPLPKADPSVVTETDQFIDSIKDMAPHDQKQKLGDQLFKKIRSFGFKGAPKITISLLDSEDLRALAHLMNSYPECLREKVALQTGK